MPNYDNTIHKEQFKIKTVVIIGNDSDVMF
jgi:hypothetical protein